MMPLWVMGAPNQGFGHQEMGNVSNLRVQLFQRCQSGSRYFQFTIVAVEPRSFMAQARTTSARRSRVRDEACRASVIFRHSPTCGLAERIHENPLVAKPWQCRG